MPNEDEDDSHEINERDAKLARESGLMYLVSDVLGLDIDQIVLLVPLSDVVSKLYLSLIHI